MTFEDQIKSEKLKFDINREAAKKISFIIRQS